MDECSILQAALKHNPLFPLCRPVCRLSDTSTTTAAAAASPVLRAIVSADVTEPAHAALTLCHVTDLVVTRADPDTDSSVASAGDTAGGSMLSRDDSGAMQPQNECFVSVASSEVRPVRAKSKQRQDRKRRKMAALVNLINMNDSAASPRESSLSPCRKSMKLDSQQKVANSVPSDIASTDSLTYAQLKVVVKKKRSKRKKPSLVLNSVGDSASLLMNPSSRTPLFFRDIQTLLLNALAPDFAPWPPRWCSLRHAGAVAAVVVAVVDGVGVTDLQQNRDLFATTHTLFPFQMEVVSPLHYGTCSAEELINVSLTCSQHKRLVDAKNSVQAAVEQGLVECVVEDRPPPSLAFQSQRHLPATLVTRDQLLLDITQLMEEGYPLPGVGSYSRQFADFVPTKDHYRPVSALSPMFAVDCEMCQTQLGSELTSISVLDEHETLVYTSLVKPPNPIIDYVTQYSGITKAMLQGVTVRLEDVQQKVRQLLPADAILIGQSLQFDLKAMKMLHPYVIDTSCIYNVTGVRGRKSKLAILSKIFLGEIIQTGTTGHDPTEDALAALRLVLLKLRHGQEYGDASQGGHVPALQDTTTTTSTSTAVATTSTASPGSKASGEECSTSAAPAASKAKSKSEKNCTAATADTAAAAANSCRRNGCGISGADAAAEKQQQQQQQGAEETSDLGPLVQATPTVSHSVRGVYTSLLSRVEQVGVTTGVIATGSSVEVYRVAAQSTDNETIQLKQCSNNKQVTECLTSTVSQCDLTLAHWDMARLVGASHEYRQRHLHLLNKRIRRLYRAAPSHSLLLLVASGASHPPHQPPGIDNGFCLLAVKQATSDREQSQQP